MNRKIIPFNEDYEKTNNALHRALLSEKSSMRIDHALEIAKSMPADKLNDKSLGNTPLMLALKTGNFVVAKAILMRDDVDIDVCPTEMFGKKAKLGYDHRMMGPLHLAVAFRQEELIWLILDKICKSLAKSSEFSGLTIDTKLLQQFLAARDNCGDTTIPLKCFLDPSRWPGHKEIKNKIRYRKLGTHTPDKYLLPKRNLHIIYHEDYNLQDIKLGAERYGYINSDNNATTCSIADSDENFLVGAPELTEALLFHSKLIHLNLFPDSELSFKSFPSTQHEYASNLMLTLDQTIEHINTIKPISELSSLLSPASREVNEKIDSDLIAKKASAIRAEQAKETATNRKDLN